MKVAWIRTGTPRRARVRGRKAEEPFQCHKHEIGDHTALEIEGRSACNSMASGMLLACQGRIVVENGTVTRHSIHPGTYRHQVRVRSAASILILPPHLFRESKHSVPSDFNPIHDYDELNRKRFHIPHVNRFSFHAESRFFVPCASPRANHSNQSHFNQIHG